jgi:hypothetical protein
MKNIVASIGVIALGTSAIQAAMSTGLVDDTKPWSVSAKLRGFYDDNYTTTVNKDKRDSFGFSISPSVQVATEVNQTSLGFKYTYGAEWYQDRINNNWDQSHQIEAYLNRAFTERYSIALNDSFVIAQEPSLLDPSGLTTNPYRTEGNNMRNNAQVNFTAVLTRQLSLVLGYANTFYDYEQDTPANVGAFNGSASRSALFDRMEHLALVNLRWQMMPQTVGILGYQFGVVDYSSDEFVTAASKSEARNNRSHKIYVGAEHNFSEDLKGSLQVGAQAVDYYNDPFADTHVSPYVDASLSYFYLPGSSLQAGVTHSMSQTDVVAPLGNSLTVDSESTVVYATLAHRLTAMLTGNARVQYQMSTFNGGLYDGQNDNFFDASLGLSYRFNQYLSGDVGYSFTSLSSDIPDRDYERNRIYLGVTATY